MKHVVPYTNGCLYNVSQPGIFAPGIITDYVTGSTKQAFITDMDEFTRTNARVCRKEKRNI